MTSGISIRVTGDQFDIIERRYRELGYASRSAYLKALVRIDAIVNLHHGQFVALSGISLDQQDRLDAKILDHLSNPDPNPAPARPAGQVTRPSE